MVRAEPKSSQSIDSDQATSTSAIDLDIPARGGIGYTTDGAGFEGFGYFEGFIPLRQKTGTDITFIEARLLLDNGAHLGSNFSLGHRLYDEDDNRNYAGYLGFDTRSTDNKVFPQLNLGIESLGNVWDFRINGYIPLNRRTQTGNQLLILGETASTQFQGNRLVLESIQQRQRIRDFEGALPGVDGEIGLKLAQWNRGDLRAFAGGYFYDGLGSTNALGWRLRVAAQPTENFSLGISVQDDDLFGTNIVGRISASLPGLRPKKKKLDKYQSVAIRLRNSIERTKSVTIETLRTVTNANIVNSASLQNPEEEQDYIFQHVRLGATGGDGTFENPFGTVQEALNATISDGNDIVYVDGAANVDIPAFAIPDRVQVLSRGPVQRIAGLSFPGFSNGTVRLPFAPTNNFENGIFVDLPLSGDGNFPIITGGGPDLVTLGNRTTLAGFRVQNAPGNGIVGRSVRSVELRNNVITNSGERGIFLNDIGDSAILFDNVVTGSQGTVANNSGQGLYILSTTTENALTATVNGFQFENNRVGLEVTAEGDGTSFPSQVVNIAPSTPDNTSRGTTNNVALTNSISNNTDDGIRGIVLNGGSQEVSVSDSTISNNGGRGIIVQASEAGGTDISAQEAFIQNNTINGNGLDGIVAEANALGAQELAISNNIIQNNGGAGIRATARDLGFQEFVTDSASNSDGISNNTIANNGEQGIVFNTSDFATQVADISTNSITNNNNGGPGPDLVVAATDVNSSVCIVARDNTVPAGIEFSSETLVITGFVNLQAFFQVGDRDNVAANNNGAPVALINRGTSAEDPSIFEDLTSSSCFP